MWLLIAVLALLGGLALLVWSADRFVEGAAGTAKNMAIPPLLIGMVVIGFGTSAPEMLVSGLAAWEGNPNLGLGNAFGSNITNIGLILGITALLKPITVQSQIIKRELPILIGATAVVVLISIDGHYTGFDAAIILSLFAVLMSWSIWQGLRNRDDSFGQDVQEMEDMKNLSLRVSLIWLVVGLILMIVSSRILVWGAVTIAQAFGVSDLIIGLTIIAIGTSLPELAASIAAVYKNEHDLALGNVIGSNLFNTLLVVGITLSITSVDIPSDLLYRDLPVVSLMTLALFAFAYAFDKQRQINRWEGGLLLLFYLTYVGWLIWEAVRTAGVEKVVV